MAPCSRVGLKLCNILPACTAMQTGPCCAFATGCISCSSQAEPKEATFTALTAVWSENTTHSPALIHGHLHLFQRLAVLPVLI